MRLKIEKENLLSSFFDFERNSGVYNLCDVNGVHVWDVIRYFVYTQMLWDNPEHKPVNTRLSLFQKLVIFFSFLRNVFFTLGRKNIFLIASRDKWKQTTLFFDKISNDMFELLDHKQWVAFETYARKNETIYQYKNVSEFFNPFYKIKRNIDYSIVSEICSLLKKAFPEISLSESFLCSQYKKFYDDYYFWNWIFGRLKPQQVIMVQNGIYKGLLLAAKQKKIKVIELQHGFVGDEHPAYSYPHSSDIINKVYLPNTILSFGESWFEDCYMPGVSIVSLGNNYLVPASIDSNNRNCEYNILVVSDRTLGPCLKDFIISYLNKCHSKYSFIFKLHPNQFDQKGIYESYFTSYTSVKVVTNEKTVAQWLGECNTIVGIDSTALFEAAQMNKRIIILKKESYYSMKKLFNLMNVHVIDNTDEFQTSLDKSILLNSVCFFAPFNINVAKTIVNQ